jgi:UrcA family protein
MFNRAILSAAALGVAVFAAPLAAQEASTVVSYADLDLTTEAGRATLDSRLHRAVRDVCGGYPSRSTLSRIGAYYSCVAQARESYKEQVRIALENANGRRVAVNATGLRFPA